MKKRVTIITLILAAVVGVGIFSGCNKGIFNHTPEKKAQWVVDEINEELKLSQPQLENLVAVKDHVLSLRKKFKSEHKATHQNIIGLLSQPTLDQSKLNEMIKEKTAHVNEQSPEVIALFAVFYDSLNATQQTTFRDAAEKHMTKHTHKHHN